MFQTVALILVISCAFIACGVESPASRTLIIGGNEPVVDSPTIWNTVKIESESIICSGSIIAQDVVLTAAHCIDSDLEGIRIVFGAGSESRAVRAVERLLPPGVSRFPNYDLAKVYLEGYLPAGFRPIDIGPVVSSVEVLIAGYGDSDVHCTGGACGARLLEGWTRVNSVMDNGHARHLFTTHYHPLTGGASVCFGDSGGPVYSRSGDAWKLAGITNGASLLHTPFAFPNKAVVDCKQGWGLHTSVMPFSGWIRTGVYAQEITENETMPRDWAEWVERRDVGEPSWATVDRILNLLALQPTLKPAEVSRLVTDSSFSRTFAESISAFNLRPSSKADELSDIYPLAALKGLSTLSLNDVSAKTYEAIAQLKNLKKFSIVCSRRTPSLEEARLGLITAQNPALNLTLISCNARDVGSLTWASKMDTIALSSLQGLLEGGGLVDTQLQNFRLTRVGRF
ncbi:MAG: trypsin-like serine protease [Pseudobdellovibrionaceae bacterium]|nr:trypsin-like serine protease [Pseudobdellovibrionaceae bacterium]